MMTSIWSQETYTKANRFAAEAHHGQLVPRTELPYIMHVSFVCMEVMPALTHEPERDGNLAVQCTLVQDVIEDTVVTYEDEKVGFGTAASNDIPYLSKQLLDKTNSCTIFLGQKGLYHEKTVFTDYSFSVREPDSSY